MGSLIKAGGQAEVLTARVLGSDGTQLTNTSIVDIGDGTYALYFNATACGLYHIEVRGERRRSGKVFAPYSK